MVVVVEVVEVVVVVAGTVVVVVGGSVGPLPAAGPGDAPHPASTAARATATPVAVTAAAIRMRIASWWRVAVADGGTEGSAAKIGRMTGPDTRGSVQHARLDRWLWAVRVYKTRALATEACRAGHVRIGGLSAKPAQVVRPGDVVEVRAGGWDRRLEVVRAIDKRVGAAVAAGCLVDRSPPRPPRELVPPPLFVRVDAPGRPTKRDRRALDRFRGR